MPKMPSTALRFAAMPIIIGLIAWIETRQPFTFFRLVSLILAFFLLADVASLMRGKSRDLALALASLVFGLSLIEGAATALEVKQMLVVTPGWSVFQPITGWGAEHPGRYHAVRTDPKTGATIYSADYTIDSNLLRQTNSAKTGPAIVFFGDSFTFGFGVNDADTLPQLFADSLDRKQRVLNLGVGGFGPQQFLREMQTGLYDSVIGPQPKLFIFMTAVWHAERTACKYSWGAHAPLYAVENDQLVFKGACYEGLGLWAQQFLWNSASYRLFVEPFRQKMSHDDIELYIRIVLAAVKLAKEKYGVPTLIPYIPEKEDYFAGTGFSDEAIIQRLTDGGAIVIDVSIDQKAGNESPLKIPGDGHPTPLANRIRAGMLKTFIQQHISDVLLSKLE
ncbi:MAG: SGNH/GDSL hydrolase family protein [Methylocella sp.]